MIKELVIALLAIIAFLLCGWRLLKERNGNSDKGTDNTQAQC